MRSIRLQSRARVTGALLAACVCAGVGEQARQGTEVAAETPARPAPFAVATPRQVGRTLSVRGRRELQRALDEARGGDTIVVPAGSELTGPFTLRRKPGRGFVVVRTSALDALPPAGERVGESDARHMPKLQSSSGPVLTAEPGARGYWLVGLEIRPAKGAFLYNLVDLGSGVGRLEDLPQDIVLDRCYLHGDPEAGGRRGIAMNARYAAVIDSRLADFKEMGADSQAIASWNGAGPFRIVNNYIEAAGENVLFGGGDPTIPDLVPSDIEIRRNHFYKPPEWNESSAEYRGKRWTVKNLLELKNARRVLIEGNRFENHWVDAQSGFAILFTVRNQDGGAPWSVVEDVTFANNIVMRTPAGVNVLGKDETWPSGSRRTRRVAIRNNVFVDLEDRLFQVLDGTEDVTIEHNTALQAGNVVTAGGEAHERFVFRNNIVLHNEYGIIGSGAGVGNASLDRYFPGSLVRGNLFVGGDAVLYPAGNFFAASIDEVGFVSVTEGDLRLGDRSPFRGVGEGDVNPGVDLDVLESFLGENWWR